jgi:carboxyl-terminal processing protease
MFRHKSGRKTLRLVIVGMLAVVLVAAMASEAPARRSPFEPLSIFARALAYIEVSYLEPIDQERLVYGAIRGLADSLDPHSVFLDPIE